MYEGGIIVPACAVWPGVIEPGSRSDQLLMTMDIYPTVCEAAGVPLMHSIEGQSFLTTLRGEKSPHQTRDMVWVRREGNMRYQGRDYYALEEEIGNWFKTHLSHLMNCTTLKKTQKKPSIFPGKTPASTVC
jgi:arylsulfatase A-like enzyme